MPLTDLAEARLGGSISLRNEPVQARSTARLSALLDAAAAAVAENGYERLTTAMVAERAGASIGTVYRYFPDRIAVLQALASRNLERVTASIHAALADGARTSAREALGAGFDTYVEAFRSEPGFASLRGGDVIDLRPATTPAANSQLAEAIVVVLFGRFGVDDSKATRLSFETAIEVMDALVARAFARDPRGDTRFLDNARELVLSIVGQ